MAVLTPIDVAVTGVADAFVAAAGGGDSFDNNGLCLVVINNGSGGSITVTFDDPGTPAPVGASAFNADVAVAIPAGAKRTFGPFPPWRFNDANGRVNIAYSGVTTLTIEVLRIRP